MRAHGLAAALLSGCLLFSLPAQATDWSVAAGIGLAPDYLGSEDYEPIPLWNFEARGLYHPETYVQIRGPKFNSNFLPHDNFRLGLSAQYVFKRNDVDNNSVDRMRPTDDGLMLGIMGGYDFHLDGGGILGIELDARYDVQDDIGGLFTVRGHYMRPFGSSWVFNAGVDTTLATDDYMDEFFGVNALNVGASGFTAYNPDGGFRDVGVDAALTYRITDTWSVTGLTRYTRLVGDADDSSPVVNVGSENQFIAGVLIGARF